MEEQEAFLVEAACELAHKGWEASSSLRAGGISSVSGKEQAMKA